MATFPDPSTKNTDEPEPTLKVISVPPAPTQVVVPTPTLSKIAVVVLVARPTLPNRLQALAEV